jgi:hypothetical protein
MKRRQILAALSLLPAAGLLPGCAAPAPEMRGTGDLGVIIERARGKLAIVDTSRRVLLGEVDGLGDLSHASVVFSRDGLYAYVFGRDGGLTKVNLQLRRIEARVMQAGNSIGGAISADGSLVAAQNYTPGGVKVFDAATLDWWPTCRPSSIRWGRPASCRAWSVWSICRAPLRLQPVRRRCDLDRRSVRSGPSETHEAERHRSPAL